jgi:hypothetical protein
MAATASDVPKMDMPIPPSPQNSSSFASGRDSPVRSDQVFARNS